MKRNFEHWAWDYAVSVIFFILVVINWQQNWIAGFAGVLWTGLVSYRLFVKSKPKKM